MPITDIQPRRHNRIPRAGVRVVAGDKHGVVIATYPATTWVLLDGQRTFTPFDPKELVYELGSRAEG